MNFPVKEFNDRVRDGSAGTKLEQILGDIKPEAVYFYEERGERSVILIVDLPKPSAAPSIAEPWFLAFNASVHFRIVMSPEELANAGLEALGKTYEPPRVLRRPDYVTPAIMAGASCA